MVSPKIVEVVVVNKQPLLCMKFPYSPETVERVKKLIHPHTWNPAIKAWTTSVLNLPVIKKYFTDFEYDPSALNVLQRMKEADEKSKFLKSNPFPYSDQIPTIQLRDYQKQGLNYIYHEKFAGLYDEQGLGKTVISLALMYYLLRVEKSITKVLVTCPKSLTINWIRELERFTDLKGEVIDGPVANRGTKLLASSAEVLITNHSTLTEIKRKTGVSSVLEQLSHLCDQHQVMLILDEAHRLKSIHSSIFKTSKKFFTKAKRRLFLTGTMIADNPIDAFAQMLLLDGGELLGKTITPFKQVFVETEMAYFPHMDRYIPKVTGYKNLPLLRYLLSLRSIRRTTGECLELPPLTEKRYYVEMDSVQRKVYNDVATSVSDKINLDQELDNSLTLGVVENAHVSHLIQAATWLGFVDPVKYKDHTSSKIKELDLILEEMITQSGKKVILWTSFVANNFVGYLRDRYSDYGAVDIYGSTKHELRQENLDNFQTSQHTKLLIANPQTAGEGLTLTAATISVYLNRSFNRVHYSQSLKRNHRFGQNESCLAIHLISRESIDEKVANKLQEKQNIADFLHGDTQQVETAIRTNKE